MTPPTVKNKDSSAVIVVWDDALALSLEMSLVGAGMRAQIRDAAADLADLALEPDSTLVISSEMLPRDPTAMASRMREAGWNGLAVVLTQHSGPLLGPLASLHQFAVLEMPFMSNDLITRSAPRAATPASDRRRSTLQGMSSPTSRGVTPAAMAVRTAVERDRAPSFSMTLAR